MFKKGKVIAYLFIFIILISVGWYFIVQNSSEQTVSEEQSDSTQVPENNPNNTLQIVTGEWPPYVSKSKKDLGFITKIVRRSFEKSNVSISIQFDSWARSRKMLDSNTIFASYPWYYIEDNLNKYKTTVPIIKAEEKLMYLKTNQKVPKTYEKVSELRNLKIGGIRGYSHMEVLKKCDVDPEASVKDSNAVKNLYNGRIDVLAINPLVAQDVIRIEYPEEEDQFAFIEKPIIDLRGMGLLINKEYPDADKYIKLFNQGFSELIESGEYDEILEEYKIDKKYSIKNN